MSITFTPPYAPQAINTALAGATQVAALSTLFDGKILNQEDPLIWDNAGTGTPTFNNNTIDLAVTAGQYRIRQARFFTPYFAGRAHRCELTATKFQFETGLTKRLGYFSSNAVAPYDSTKDGWWIESGAGTYKLIVANAGTEIFNVDWTAWDGYAEFASYDWSKFTVAHAEFLWLGGAGLRLFFKAPGNAKWILAHTVSSAGTGTIPFMKSPQQPLRYEIRSSTGVGTFTAICADVGTLSTETARARDVSVANLSTITTNTVGTIYALKGIRKVAAFRDTRVKVTSYGGGIQGTASDAGILLLLLNPTLSAPLTWAANSQFEEGTAVAQTITAGTGTLLASHQLFGSSSSQMLTTNILSSLPVGIDNTMGQIILAYSPFTVNQKCSGTINVSEA